jgi:hypothetical protein
VIFLTFKRHSTGQESSELSELARQAGARRAASRRTFRNWIGIFKNGPMANSSEEYFHLI